MNEFDMGLFSRRLRLVIDYRSGENGTYSSWCRKHGINQNTMSGWLNGTHPPSMPGLFKLCKELGVSADFLLGLEE